MWTDAKIWECEMQDSKMQDQTKYEKKLTNKLDKFIFKSHTQ